MKKQKGITLIALIITIIVMLILVAVTINVAVNGGLFSRAKNAKEQTQIEADKESLLMAAMACIGEDGKVDFDKLDAEAIKLGFTKFSDGVYSKGEYSYSVNRNTGKISVETGIAIATSEDGKGIPTGLTYTTYEFKDFSSSSIASMEKPDGIDFVACLLAFEDDTTHEDNGTYAYITVGFSSHGGNNYFAYQPDYTDESVEYRCHYDSKSSSWVKELQEDDSKTTIESFPTIENARILTDEETIAKGLPSNQLMTQAQINQILQEVQ